jgi:CheY-like chemotaxis protein
MTPAPTKAEVTEAMRALRERYKASIANTVGGFRYLAAQLTVAPDKAEVLESLRRELHRVHGTAGSFGFPDASRLAGVLEARAVGWVTDPGSDRATRGAIIAHFASALEAHVLGTTPFAPPTAPAPDSGPRTADTTPHANSKPPEAVSSQSAVRSPDVIFVEDDPSLSDMLRYALDATGYSHQHFATGPEALEALLALQTGNRRPVVLLDVDLPGLDGFSLYERLRAARPNAFAVVFFTVHAAEAEQLRAYRAGVIDYVTKPVNMRILMAKIPSWLAAAGGGPRGR